MSARSLAERGYQLHVRPTARVRELSPTFPIRKHQMNIPMREAETRTYTYYKLRGREDTNTAVEIRRAKQRQQAACLIITSLVGSIGVCCRTPRGELCPGVEPCSGANRRIERCRRSGVWKRTCDFFGTSASLTCPQVLFPMAQPGIRTSQTLRSDLRRNRSHQFRWRHLAKPPHRY